SSLSKLAMRPPSSTRCVGHARFHCAASRRAGHASRIQCGVLQAMSLPTDGEGDDADDDAADGGDHEDVPIAGAAEHRFTVDPARAGERIDALIADLVPALSRAAVQRLIDA